MGCLMTSDVQSKVDEGFDRLFTDFLIRLGPT